MVRGEISKFVVKLWSVRRIRESVLCESVSCEGGLIGLLREDDFVGEKMLCIVID